MVEVVRSGSLKALSGCLDAVQKALSGGYASEGSRYPTYDSLIDYQKVMVALKETIQLMAEIDEQILGWSVE